MVFRRSQSGTDEGNYSTSCEVITCGFCCFSQSALHGVHSPCSHSECGAVRWAYAMPVCMYCLCVAGRVSFSTRASGTQPGFWRGEGLNLGTSTKRGSGGVTPEKFWKTYMRFDALYYICCTKIINFANLKVMFFSDFIIKNICNCKKHTRNLNYYYYTLNKLPDIKM